MTQWLTLNPEHKKPGFFAFAVLCVVLAILVRSVIPVGFMPDLKGGQPFKMVICSIDGPKTVLLDQDFNSQPVDSQPNKPVKAHGSICEFSLNTASIDAVPPLLVAPAPMTAGFHYCSLLINSLSSQWFFGNASSRSPPVSFYA